MAKEKKGQGFQSAAGLIRYFDAEDDNAIQMTRWFVISCTPVSEEEEGSQEVAAA